VTVSVVAPPAAADHHAPTFWRSSTAWGSTACWLEPRSSPGDRVRSMLVDNLVSLLAELALSLELSRTLGVVGGRIRASPSQRYHHDAHHDRHDLHAGSPFPSSWRLPALGPETLVGCGCSQAGSCSAQTMSVSVRSLQNRPSV
jgi:hypothetical protein